MRLYDSRRRSVERFRPRPGEPVTMYICGITPYDTTHLGHAFTYIVFDVLARHLETVHRWPVLMAQNLTDIDDDVLKKAAETGEDWRARGLRWTDRFREDLGALNLKPPSVYPAATAHIAAIVADVEALIAVGLAYESAGSVYFEVAKDPAFGAIDGRPYADLLRTANDRGNWPDDPGKRDPLDFVLWQAAKPGEPAWHSNWGDGRPGWHIECSAMARAHLGPVVDVHGGGADLLFPHHACEMAQAEPLVDAHPWVRFWAHVAMVRMNGQKMSKSLGNLVHVGKLLEHHEPDTIRLYLLRHHYRTEWEWNAERFESEVARMRTLHAAAARESQGGSELDFSSAGPRIARALDDDLDTPAAIEAVLDLADSILEAPFHADVRGAQDVLRATAGDVLGFWLKPAAEIDPSSHPNWPAPVVGEPDLIA